jgi:hypothetical protein
MPIKYFLPGILLAILILNSGCETWLVLTSRYHEPKTETPESITRFTKKSNIDGYPILRFDTSYLQTVYLWTTDFPVYNSTGHSLSLRDSLPGCPDKKQNYVAMKYILQHGDEHFIQDSMIRRYSTTKDSAEEAKLMANHSMSRPQLDSSLWEFHVEKYCTHLDQMSPHLLSLEGGKINIHNLYSDYLVVNEFLLAGRPSLQNYLIKEKIKDIKKLNKEFGNRIQLVLINMDRME